MVGEALLIAVSALGPLAFGCVERWSLAALQTALLGMFLWGWLQRPAEASPPARGLLLAPALAVILIGGLQWLHAVPIDAPRLWSALPFTASSYETGNALVLWWSYAALLWCAPAVLSRPDAKERYAWALLLAAAVFASIGVIQLHAGNKLVFGFREVTYGRSPFGPYYNTGHAASLLATVLPLGLGLFGSRMARRRSFLERGMRPSEFAASQATLLLLVAAIGYGLLSARNRGAMLALAASACVTAFWGCRFLRSRPAAASLRLTLVLAPLALAVFIRRHPASTGFREGFKENSVAFRAAMYRGSLKLIADYPLWGVGLGAVSSAFPPYKERIVDGVVDHVHSDWLEFPMQTGLAGLAAIAAGFLLLARRFWARTRPGSREDLRLEAGALAGAACFLAHAMVEFNFQTPANAVVFLALLAWLGTDAAEPGADPESRQPQHPSRGRPPAVKWLPALVALALMLRACVPVIAHGFIWRSKGLPTERQIALLKQAYRLDPNPQTAFRIGYLHLRGRPANGGQREPWLRHGLAMVRRALLADPVNPYLNKMEGSFLISLNRKMDAESQGLTKSLDKNQ
ncbi:MAG: O-antigen ligase family protein [Elusimicrobia bacterium]|nr:O-antigen ligase family protein [Elusimicrobiota bacterium]